jgi:hypothetical protein
MYAGRVGPLTFGLALFIGKSSDISFEQKHPDDLVV